MFLVSGVSQSVVLVFFFLQNMNKSEVFDDKNDSFVLRRCWGVMGKMRVYDSKLKCL